MAEPATGPILERRGELRAEERPVLESISAALRRWRFLIYVAFAVLLAFGFDFKTPAAQFKALRDKNTEQDQQIADLARYVRAIAIGQCLDRPRRDTDLMGLNCDQLLRSGRIP